MENMFLCKWEGVARSFARQSNIDEWVFSALINVESGYNPNVRGGIAQIDPTYHDVNVSDPLASLEYAAHLVRSYLNVFGRYDMAVAAYNAGGPTVRAVGGVPNGHTNQYVMRILSDSISMRSNPPVCGAGSAEGVMMLGALLMAQIMRRVI